ncbi:MAG TPA: efflux RND transporter periplasmic adaptor subunit [Nitrospirota bacterium]|jgi:HlyD family secretion protein
MRKPSSKLFLGILVAAAAFAVYYLLYMVKPEGPEPVRTTGVVEALEYSISSKIPGKVTAVKFSEGDQVKLGELIASIQNADLEASLKQAQSTLVAAEATASSSIDLVESARAQVKVAVAQVGANRAAVRRAEAQLAQADKDLARAKELFKRGIISRADLDQAETARESRAADLESAKASLALAQSGVSAAQAALKKAQGDVKTADAQANAARDTVAFQEARLADSQIFSPADGIVEYRSVEQGEVVSPGQSILTLYDAKSLWVRIDLEQRYTARVKVGDKANITIDGMPGKVLTGSVFDVGWLGNFATERDVTRGRQDIKTFRTRIKVENPEGLLKPGMTVEVEI